MSGSFPVVPLGDVLTKSIERIDLNPDERYRQVTVRLWGKGVVLRDEVNGVDIGASKRFVVRSQQFILSRIDARNGAFGLVPDYLDGAVVSSDFPVFTVDPLQITPEFLKWMSKTHFFVELCKTASEGTTNRVRLKEDRFLATKIPLPSLEEQRRIVARIEELAAMIEEAQGLRRQAVEKAEALVKATYRNSFKYLKLNKKLPLNDIMMENGQQVKAGQIEYLDYPYLSLANIEAHTGRILEYRTCQEEGIIGSAVLFGTGDVLKPSN